MLPPACFKIRMQMQHCASSAVRRWKIHHTSLHVLLPCVAPGRSPRSEATKGAPKHVGELKVVAAPAHAGVVAGVVEVAEAELSILAL